MNIKKSQLKQLIKGIVQEIRRRNTGSNEYEMNVDFDNFILQGIMQSDDWLRVTLYIEYDFDAGEEARGMYGPPENYDPGEGASADIQSVTPMKILIMRDNNVVTETDFESLQPEHRLVVDKAVKDYVKKHSDDIENNIIERESSNW